MGIPDGKKERRSSFDCDVTKEEETLGTKYTDTLILEFQPTEM
jgi:hypothetical protein